MNWFIFLLLFLFITVIASDPKERNRWVCVNDQYCQRLSDVDIKFKNQTFYPRIELCRMICGVNGPIWPRPKKVQLSKDIMLFKNLYVTHSIGGQVKLLLDEIITVFKQKVLRNSYCFNNNSVVIKIDINSNDTTLNWQTDESYHIYTVKNKPNIELNVLLTASNIYGIRHGLETLSQLIEPASSCLAIVNNVVIRDGPVYPHRGLMLDTSRNFITVNTIKKHIDAMGTSKMNYLHWHITDSQSFPFDSPRVPEMTTYGALSPEMVYNYKDVKELVHYAKIRGINILFELDTPSHAGLGWQWGPDAGLGNLAVCINKQPWRSYCGEAPCGQINPANQNVYSVLEKIYKDMHDLTLDLDIFHMGGDEVNVNCWNSTQEIIDYLGNKTRSLETFLDLWGEFQEKATKTYRKISNKSSIILWTSDLTNPKIIEKYLDNKTYVIQVWTNANDKLPIDLLEKNYKLIISTQDRWYLDHGFWGTTSYKQWQTVYNHKIPLNPLVLGGEVCMWTEFIDDSAVEGRVWPRAAAASERLWSNPTKLYSEAAIRFYRHRERLVDMGVNAETVAPKWCYLNEGFCL